MNKRAEKRTARKRKIKWVNKFVASVRNLKGYIDNRKEKRIKQEKLSDFRERQRIINSMTNWQRNQAGRACKGKWDNLSKDNLIEFASRKHWKGATS